MILKEEEINYLADLINGATLAPGLFFIEFGEGKYVLGVTNTKGERNKFFEYKTIYDTVTDLKKKIEFSCSEAIKYAYADYEDKFNPFSSMSRNEEMAIYFTENAVFRTSTLWDILAQLYNIEYEIIDDVTKIHYKRFFKTQLTNPIANTITDYIEQGEDTSTDPWNGNHGYVNTYRNKMTHRNSPNVTTVSDFDMEIRMPMQYVLKRVVEDYVQVITYLNKAFNDVNEELIKENGYPITPVK